MPSFAKRHNLLLVEDDPILRELYRIRFTDAGYNYFEATDGIEAVELASEQPMDAIITDFDMPKLNGIGLIRKLRKHAWYEGIPILVLSGVDDPDIRGKARMAGATDWLVKPVSLLIVITALTCYLSEAEPVAGLHNNILGGGR